MAELIGTKVDNISIEEEMRRSYLDYAMSVIVSRALPDVRDGLKPVHRRILYAQSVLGNVWNKSYKKSARVVGDVIGKYHPHGDTAVYDALVRLAQDFSMRLPLEDGQGNFGSMDGDAAAAMRYTEVRMAKVADYLLADLDKDTVDFEPNYDGQDMEPAVLPARFPNVLVNGSGGIAVGMATNIPPHNLAEVVDASIMLIDEPDAGDERINQIVKGPDFPTGGQIIGTKGIITGNAIGRGSVTVRAKTHFENVTDSKEAIIVTEVPYQVNKAKLVERIAELVRDKTIEDISDLRDESDRKGVRVVIELKRGANADVVLNQLFKHTNLQTSFGYNMLALVDNGRRPRLMGVREILQHFLKHREQVITRRTRFELNKARARAHLLAGLATAVANIDEIIALIRNAPDPATAKAGLMGKAWNAESVRPLIELLGEFMEGSTYTLSERQAQAILELRLHRLTGLERDKINDEANEIQATIQELVEILSNRTVLLDLMKAELNEVKELFATPRRTEIIEGGADMSLEDLITPEDMVVTISSDGYVKRLPMTTYRAQRRGGKGKTLGKLRDNEEMDNLFIANTHDPLLFFSTTGKVYTLKVYDLPQASTQSRGKAFVNLLPLEKNEIITGVVPLPRDESVWENYHLLFATREGLIRKTPLTAFNNVRATGIKGIGLNDGDVLVSVHLCASEEWDVLISTSNGQAVRFPVANLRPIASRTAMGVRGITLKDKDSVISMHLLDPAGASHVLTITEHGYGKRTPVDDFPVKGRGTMGVISIKTTNRNGQVVTSMPVGEEDQVMIATSDGQVIRTTVSGISTMGRNTQGVRLFDVGKSSKVSLVFRIPVEMLVEKDDAADASDDAEKTPDMLEKTSTPAVDTVENTPGAEEGAETVN